MPYYEDMIKIFKDYCDNYNIVIYFYGKGKLPTRIVLKGYTYIRDVFKLQNDYIDYLKNKFGECAILGDSLEHCVEFDYVDYPDPDYVLRGGMYVQDK